MFSSGWPGGAGYSGIGHCVTLFFVAIVGWLVAVWIVGSLRASCGVLWGLLKVFLPKACMQRSLCRWSVAQLFKVAAN